MADLAPQRRLPHFPCNDDHLGNRDMARSLQVTLPDDLMQDIADAVESGEAPTTNELVNRALDAYFRMDREKRLAALRARIADAVNDPRPSVPIGEAFERIRADVSRRHRQS
ncbi:ribbon-helix-helix domain-containing protein [Jiella avicenniae]|uniref:ribbon-helix-helix domain-containing protein n=1 Tax=Jiella avicenniae TaxID=2907202 RepID=UPI001F37EFEE|nr:hypothetical protein [Jiella avicenniae]